MRDLAHREPIVIKKYSNRRLYTTDESRYVTLEELAEKIRRGRDVRVVDASTGDDLTQATLTQIILESRGAGRLLPVPLLLQLVRMGDDALAEFLGRYMSAALELYIAAREGTRGVMSLHPLMRAVSPGNPIARFLGGVYGLAGQGQSGAPSGPRWTSPPPMPAEPAWEEPAPPIAPPVSDATSPRSPEETLDVLASLQRQIESLRRTVAGGSEEARVTAKTRPATAKKRVK